MPAVALIWHLAAPFVPYPVRVFGDGDIVAAVDWLDGLSDGGFSVELRERDGIVLASADRPLRAEDVDALAREVDRWTGEHGAELTGLVIRVPESPAPGSYRSWPARPGG